MASDVTVTGPSLRAVLLCSAGVLLIGALWHSWTWASEDRTAEEELANRWSQLALPADCEDGFRRLIRMAQTGQLGADVVNANVAVYKNHARVELVRTAGPNAEFLLIPKAEHSRSRYFDVQPGAGASEADAGRLAAAISEVFSDDPFQLTYGFFNAVPRGALIPDLAAAWSDGGWRGVLHATERRVVAPVGLPYTIALIVGLTFAALAGMLLLWGSTPPHRQGGG